eukprot:GHRR01016016.1.p1 GENE.GHRR01016016.1~~GHRR01016016.1.p1  ORF type:complete len:211 (-),score=38.71 GHRR01016016.1:656-1288(-)
MCQHIYPHATSNLRCIMLLSASSLRSISAQYQWFYATMHQSFQMQVTRGLANEDKHLSIVLQGNALLPSWICVNCSRLFTGLPCVPIACLQMEQSFKMQISTGLAEEGEADEIKRIFLEGNPYLLGLTMAVSMLHTVFDFLAFKNDIGFWKDNKSMEGLSARSIVINAFCQLVIFLYLLDNETSMVVLLSAGELYCHCTKRKSVMLQLRH